MENIDDAKNEENKKSKNSLFTGTPEGEHLGTRNRNDLVADTNEDIEAAIQAQNIIEDEEASYEHPKPKKVNGFITEENSYPPAGKMNTEDIDDLGLEKQEEVKGNRTQTNRKYNDQRGGSGMPYDAGDLDSPNSATPINKNKQNRSIRSSSSKGMLQESAQSQDDSKDDLGWNEELKNKGKSEEGKHDEERSLLDPHNEDELYSKGVIPKRSEFGDGDIRRNSTKPDGPQTPGLNKSAGEIKPTEEKEEEENRPKEMSQCQKKSIAFLDSWQWGIFMTIITIYTLFFDDIRILLIPKAADDAFYTLTTI